MTFIRSDFVLAVDGAGEIADANRELALSRYFMGLEASRWKRGLREPDLLDALLLHVSVEADVGRLRSFLGLAACDERRHEALDAAIRRKDARS